MPIASVPTSFAMECEKESKGAYDIVNIGWHIYLKDITDYAARSKDW